MSQAPARTPTRKLTAAEYDAMVNARVFGAAATGESIAKRHSSTPARLRESEEEVLRRAPSSVSRRKSVTRTSSTASAKKKQSSATGSDASDAAPATPHRTASSSSKKKPVRSASLKRRRSSVKRANVIDTTGTSSADEVLAPTSSSASSDSTAAAVPSRTVRPSRLAATSTHQHTDTSPSRAPSPGDLSPDLRVHIPADARAVDLNQVARLSGLSSSPIETEPEDEEDEKQLGGPKGYLTQKGLQTLKEYKYVSGFTGATDKYVMIPLWNWSLQFVPLWMAPNLLTTMSLACGIACYFLFQYHSPDFLDEPPAWVFFFTSFLMFAYLILDGLDGKQARRTGSSSPLGQLFDHGCDSICCFLCGIFMCSCLHLGSHRASAIILLLHILPFYTSNWEEYCTGVMRFGLIGITEGQLLICALLAFTGYTGVGFWNRVIPIPSWVVDYMPTVLKPSFNHPMEYKFILVFVGTLGVLYQVFSSSLSVWQYHTAHAEERRTKKIYNKAKRMFTHFLAFLVAGIAWVSAPSVFFRDHPRIVLLTIGVLFGYQVSRLIISRVTKDPYPFGWLNLLFVPYLTLIVNCWIGEPLATYPIAVAYLAFLALAYTHFIVVTINQICAFLRIDCFKIPYAQTKRAQ